MFSPFLHYIYVHLDNIDCTRLKMYNKTIWIVFKALLWWSEIYEFNCLNICYRFLHVFLMFIFLHVKWSDGYVENLYN